MKASLPAQYSAYGAAVYTVEFTQLSLLAMCARRYRTYLHHLFVGQSMVLQRRIEDDVTVLPEHIFKVFLLSTRKQMKRINARRVITLMANVHAYGNWAVNQFVSYSMSQPNFAIIKNLSIPLPSFTSIPYPTFVGSGDMPPKKIFHRYFNNNMVGF